MDEEEFRKLLDDARARGASLKQLEDLVDRYNSLKEQPPKGVKAEVESGGLKSASAKKSSVSESTTKNEVEELRNRGLPNQSSSFNKIMSSLNTRYKDVETTRDTTGKTVTYNKNTQTAVQDPITGKVKVVETPEKLVKKTQGYSTPVLRKDLKPINLTPNTYSGVDRQNNSYTGIQDILYDSRDKINQLKNVKYDRDKELSYYISLMDVDSNFSNLPYEQKLQIADKNVKSTLDFEKEKASKLKKLNSKVLTDIEVRGAELPKYEFIPKDSSEKETDPIIKTLFPKLNEYGINSKDFDEFVDKNSNIKDYYKRGIYNETGVPFYEGDDKIDEDVKQTDIFKSLQRYTNKRLNYLDYQTNVYKKLVESGKEEYKDKINSLFIESEELKSNLQQYKKDFFPIIYNQEKTKKEESANKVIKERNGEGSWYDAPAKSIMNIGKSATGKSKDMYISLLDTVGLNDVADNLRISKESHHNEGTDAISVGGAFSGKKVTYEGNDYTVTEDKRIIDNKTERDVTSITEELGIDYQSVLNLSKQSKETHKGISWKGATEQAGHILGDLATQMIFTKGLGAGIGGASKLLLGLKAVPKAMQISNSLSIGTMMYSTASEETFKQLNDAGVEYNKAKDLANQAGLINGAVGMATGYILPDVEINKLFSGGYKGIVKDAMNKLGTTGEKGFLRYLKDTSVRMLSEGAKGYGKELPEEFIQQGIELGFNGVINNKLNKEILQEEITADEWKNIALQTAFMTPLSAMSGFTPKDKLSIYNEIIHTGDYDKIVETLDNETTKGFYSREKADLLKRELELTRKYDSSVPRNVTPEKRFQIFPLLKQRDELEVEKKNTDKFFHKEKDDKIEGVNNSINDILITQLKQPTTETPQEEFDLTEKIKTDFDGTVYDGKNLTKFGEEVKRRIKAGQDITILSSREDTDNNRNLIAEQLGINPDNIKLGLSPKGKAQNLEKGDVFYDSNAENIKEASKVKDINTVNTGENLDIEKEVKVQENNNNNERTDDTESNTRADDKVRRTPTTEGEFTSREKELGETERGLVEEQKQTNVKTGTVDTSTINVNPDIFQFKKVDEDSGVNKQEKLDGKFDEDMAQTIGVWVDEKGEVGEVGKTYVVDGHHRVDLAKRTNTPKMNVFYINAKTAKEARLVAAKTNIAQGRGTAIDAAKVYRDTETKDLVNFSPKSKVGRDGNALSKLSDLLFKLVVDGKISIERGVILSEGKDQAVQEAVYKEVQRVEGSGSIKMKNSTIKEYIDAGNSSNKQTETVVDLFGESLEEKVDVATRMELVGDVREKLKKDKNVFGAAARNAETLNKIEENRIDKETNEQLSDKAAENLTVFDILKNTKSFSEVINKAVEDYKKAKDRKTKSKIKEDLYNDLRKIADNELKPKKEKIRFQKSEKESKTRIVSTVKPNGLYEIEWSEPKQSAQQSIDITPELKTQVEIGLPLFRKNNQDQKPFETKETTPATKENIQQKFPDAIVVQSESELPQPIQSKIKQQKVDGTIKGVYYNGEVYMVADNIKTLGEAEGTYRHERLGHKGVTDYLGVKLSNYAKSVVNNSKGGKLERLKIIAKKYGLPTDFTQLTSEQRQELGEEYIAYVSENKSKLPNWWNEVVSVVRKTLRDLGIDLQVSDSEIQTLINKVEKGLDSKLKDYKFVKNINNENDTRFRNRTRWDESRGNQTLEGVPIIQTRKNVTGADPEITYWAEEYARRRGIDYKRQSKYVKVNEGIAKRIANAYEQMKHEPQNPKVKEAYQNLIEQTKDQYEILVEAGYRFYLFDSSNDPYKGNPWATMEELRNNKTIGIFTTEDGYGSSDFDSYDNPMLVDTGIKWGVGSLDGKKKRVLANDLFRAVHDVFGHGLEGSGFRARGEENAWQSHARLFTGTALGAITSETRGQNSWLNYGKYGEQNSSAKVEDTIFADQKIGLMPEWTWKEGFDAGNNDIRFQKKTEEEKKSNAVIKANTIKPKNEQDVRDSINEKLKSQVAKDKLNKYLTAKKVGAKELQGFKTEFSKYLKEKLSDVSMTPILKSEVQRLIDKINSVNENNIEQLQSEVDNLFDKIENRGLYKDFRTAKSKMKSISRSKSNNILANISSLAKSLSQIDDRYLKIEDKQKYLDNMNDVIKATKSITDDKRYQMANENEVRKSIERLSQIAEGNYISKIAEELDIDIKDFTKEELIELWKSENFDADLEKKSETKRKIIRDRLIKMAEYAKLGLSEKVFQNITLDEKKQLDIIKKADLSKLTPDQLKIYSRVVDNMIINEDFSKAGNLKDIIEVNKKVDTTVNRKNFFIRKFDKETSDSVIKFLKATRDTMTSLDNLLARISMTKDNAAFLRNISGAENLSMANVKTLNNKDKFLKTLSDVLDEMAKTNPNIRTGENNIKRSVYGLLLQSKKGDKASMDNFKENYIRHTIEELSLRKESKNDKEAIRIMENILEELEDIKTKEDLIEHLEKTDKENLQVIKTVSKLFYEHAPELKAISEQYYNTPLEIRDIDEYYIPIMRQYVTEKSLVSQDPNEVLNPSKDFNNALRSSVKTGSLEARKDMARLQSGQVIMYDFDKSMIRKYAEQQYTINATSAVNQIKLYFNNKEVMQKLGGSGEWLKAMLANKIMIDAGKATHPESTTIVRTIHKFGNFLGGIGIARALGDITQPVKQATNILAGATFRLGTDAGLIGTYAFTRGKDSLGLIQMSSVSRRAESQAGFARVGDNIKFENLSIRQQKWVSLQAEKLMNSLRGFEMGGKKVPITRENAIKMSMSALSWGDVQAAETTFLAYYHSKLREVGVKDSDIDIKTEHLRQDDPIRKQAFSYATHMISMTQTSSDLSEGSELLVSQDTLLKIISTLVIPYSTHSNNASVKVINNLGIALSTEKGIPASVRKENFNEAVISISEIAMFHSVKALLLAPLSFAAYKAAWGDDEDEYDWMEAIELTLKNTGWDVSPLPDKLERTTLNWLLYMNDGDRNKERGIESFEEWQDFNRDIEKGNKKGYNPEEASYMIKGFETDKFYSVLGKYAGAFEAVDYLSQGYNLYNETNEYVGTDWGGYKNKYEFNQDNKRFLATFMTVEAASLFGATESFSRRLLEKRFREVKKQSKIQKEKKGEQKVFTIGN